MKSASRVAKAILVLFVCYGCSFGVATPKLSFQLPTESPEVIHTTTVEATQATRQFLSTPTGVVPSTPSTDKASGIYIISSPLYRVLVANNLTVQPTTKTKVIEPPTGVTQGVGASLVSTFSHFSGMVAYWLQSTAGELWISDVEFKNPKRIFVDAAKEYVGEFAVPYGAVRLIWSADDSYLIVDATQIGKKSFIYSVGHQKVEAWPWSCDTVATSPRTSRLSTWCSSTEKESRYAVIEWGGDIWISEEPPTQVFVKRNTDQTYSWSWSNTGDKIAYFDPQDQQGRLFIADATGLKVALLPGIAWIGPITSYSFDFSNRYPIQWSRDGNRLLVFGQGSECPPQENAATGELQVRPCWQIVDVRTGQVLWLSNDISTLWPSQPATDIKIEMAVFSPDSSFLALGVFRGGPRYIVLSAIDLSRATILENFSGSDMYWLP